MRLDVVATNVGVALYDVITELEARMDRPRAPVRETVANRQYLRILSL